MITRPVEAEGILRTSGSYVGKILDSIFTRVVVVDEKSHEIVDANPNALEAIGASKEHVIGKMCHRFICPAEKGKCPISDLGQTVDKSERVLLRANGERIPILKTVTLVTWRGHKYLIESFVDITERKRMEEALGESEEKYRTQFEEALDAILVADAETGIIIDCNRAASELVGREKSELVGTHQRILHPPEVIEGEFSRTYKQHLKEKEGQVLEDRVITKNGEIKDVAIKANVFELRGKKLIQGVFRDITERKKLEDELAHERDLFRALMDNVPDPIYFKDTESRFMRVSKVSCPGLGVRNPEEAVGMTDFDFCPQGLAEQFRADDLMVMKSGEPLINKEEVMIDKIGKRWYSATKVPIRGKDGQVIGLVGISRDITKLKETEEELRRYSEHLEELVEERTRKLRQAERMAAIGETAAMVGHDLRNPLQGIVGLIYLLEKQVEDMPSEVVGKEEMAERLEMIEEQVTYMDKIVSDLRDYASPVYAELVPTCVSRLINDVLPLAAIPPNVQVSLSIPRNLPRLMLDPELMKRVFSNLIMNAVQAMPDGGRLAVKAFRESDAASISIQDTGIGIPEENLSRIFKPLFTTKSKGQGFGLAVCKRIVEAHKGTIDAESEVGRGSTFTIKIPLKREVSLVA